MDNVKVCVLRVYLLVCLKSVVGNMNQYLQLYGTSIMLCWLKIQKCIPRYISAKCDMLSQRIANLVVVLSNFTALQLNKIFESSEHISSKLICLLYEACPEKDTSRIGR